MGDRIRQLLIVGGVFQPFLLGFESVHYSGSSWAVYILYLMFLFISMVLFIFPMRRFNNKIIEKHKKLYTFLSCIGWVPYMSIPINVSIASFEGGLPEKWFDFIVSYLSFYELAIMCSFVLAIILLIRQMYDEYRTKKAKKRYKNLY